MEKCDLDRLILWLALATSALTIMGYEIEQRTLHTKTQRQQNSDKLLLDISQRLEKIEQKLETISC